MKIIKVNDLDDNYFAYKEIAEIDVVTQIIADVREQGDNAVKKYTKQFDGVNLNSIKVEPSEIQTAYDRIDNDVKSTLSAAADKIKRFARKQKKQLTNFEYEIQAGVFTGQNVIPIDRVGVYTPGGGYPLPSTVLMCCIPAKVAGVKEIALCSPPTNNSVIHPAILAAAYICEVDEVFQIGGAQAIAAMAYGTETMTPVAKIVGPGNNYVTAAKKMVYGNVGIDFIAGPSEILIIADEAANPIYIAADLLAQAEHDVHAIPVLITNSVELADNVCLEIERQLAKLKTVDIARQAINNNGLIILINKIDDAFPIANKKAPEHLELQIERAELYVHKLTNYGSLFIGSYAAEALGDYSSGLNHTLPTNTCARYTGGLSVMDFLKIQTTLRVEKQGFDSIGPLAVKLGKIEGLDGHAHSAAVRLG